MISFIYPQLLWLLLIVPVLGWAVFTGRVGRGGAVRYSTTARLRRVPKTAKIYLRHSVPAARLLVVVLLILAMAGPVSTTELDNLYAEGVDIVLSLDVSGSMQARDLDRRQQDSRLDVAKEVAEDFVAGRRHDRIGLVIFGTDAFTQCPLTLDYSVLHTVLGDVQLDEQLGQSTAIGMGLANSVRMLESGKARSKVIILLTDGVNNAGEIDPITAARMAEALGVRVYTIGVGSDADSGTFGLNVFQPRRADLDEETLQQIASISGGKYYRVRDTSALRKTFEEIDAMEKSEIESKSRHHTEKFAGFVLFAMIFLLAELVLGNTLYRRLP